VEIAEHIEQLRGDGRRLARVAGRTDPDSPVPTCPEWLLRDLVRHVGGVHRWATGFVNGDGRQPRDGDLENLVGGWPPDPELVAWFEAGHGELVRSLERAPADLEAWTFLEAPTPLAFWARRQAHETAIHRVDAESTAGEIIGFPSRFAADGIDELLLRFASRPGRELPVDRARTMTVRATDEDRTWRIMFAPDGLDTEADTEGTDAESDVAGSSSALYIWLWNRSDAGTLDVTGDSELLDVWRDAVQILWG
jgi:uncharacterized protein (TIGR03083 family)